MWVMRVVTEKELPTIVSLTAKVVFSISLLLWIKFRSFVSEWCNSFEQPISFFTFKRLYFILRSSRHSIAIDQIQFDRWFNDYRQTGLPVNSEPATSHPFEHFINFLLSISYIIELVMDFIEIKTSLYS